MKKMMFFFFMLFIYGQVFAQKLIPDIISSGGGLLTNTGIKMSYTIGEPVTSLISNSTSILSQGFQQNWENGTSFLENRDNLKVNVYPNPFIDFINISWKEDNSKSMIIELFDLNGKLLSQQEVANLSIGKQINLTNYQEGIYLLKITTLPEKQTLTFKIHKIN